MPTTVSQLFLEQKISDFKQVPWDTLINDSGQGVYVISTSEDPDKHLGLTSEPLFDDVQIENWINTVPNFTLNGMRPTIENVKIHLRQFWFNDESILYVGKAPYRRNGDGVSNRVEEYYNTRIGKGGPHSGGQWIKVLSNLNTFTVYYAFCDNPSETEHEMLDCFMKNVSESSLLNCFDQNLPLPFANIKFKGNKANNFQNQRL